MDYERLVSCVNGALKDGFLVEPPSGVLAGFSGKKLVGLLQRLVSTISDDKINGTSRPIRIARIFRLGSWNRQSRREQPNNSITAKLVLSRIRNPINHESPSIQLIAK
jgi:hypothetical protein